MKINTQLVTLGGSHYMFGIRILGVHTGDLSKKVMLTFSFYTWCYTFHIRWNLS